MKIFSLLEMSTEMRSKWNSYFKHLPAVENRGTCTFSEKRRKFTKTEVIRKKSQNKSMRYEPRNLEVTCSIEANADLQSIAAEKYGGLDLRYSYQCPSFDTMVSRDITVHILTVYILSVISVVLGMHVTHGLKVSS